MNTELTDGTILIRPFRPDDGEALYAAIHESIKELSAWMWWCHEGYSIEESNTFLMLREQDWSCANEYTFAVCDASTRELLGSTGINHINRQYKLANLGYWMRTSATGRGVASRATILTAQFAFTELDIVRLEIVADVDNLPSQRVAIKAGAKREGVLRKRLQRNGQARDAVMHSLVVEDLDVVND